MAEYVNIKTGAVDKNVPTKETFKAELDKKFDKTGGTITGDVIADQTLAAYDIVVCIPEEYKENNFSNAVGLGISPNIPVNEPLAIEFSGRYNDEAVRLAMIASPVNDSDAANKQYVDNAVAGAGMKHPIILEENTDYGDSLPANPAEGQLFFQNATSGLLVEQGGTGATTASQALTNLGGLPLTGGRMVNTTASKGVIDHPGNSSGWGNGRDNAIIRRPDAVTNAGTYFPLVSSKTVVGNWAIGTLANNLYVNFDLDTDYNAGNNKVNQQFIFGSDGYLYSPGASRQLAFGNLSSSAPLATASGLSNQQFKNIALMLGYNISGTDYYQTYIFPFYAGTWNFYIPFMPSGDYYRGHIVLTSSQITCYIDSTGVNYQAQIIGLA